MEKQQFRYAQLRAENAVDKEKRTVQFVISTEAVDSYNTVFRLDGWDFNQYQRNPIVCYNHNVFGDADNIIGTSRVFQEGNQLIGEVLFEEAEVNPLAEKIFRKVQAGTLRMASINATIENARMGIKDQGEDVEVMYFTRQSLNEWSIVSVGSNPDALKRNNEELQEIRSKVMPVKDNASAEANKNKRASRSLDVFRAQLIVNQNR